MSTYTYWSGPAVTTLYDQSLNRLRTNSYTSSSLTGSSQSLSIGDTVTWVVDGNISVIVMTYQGTTTVDGVEYPVTKAENGPYRVFGINDTVTTLSIQENIISCFLPSTLITTTQGDIAVENLQIGALIPTLSGQIVPVKWIGIQQFEG